MRIFAPFDSAFDGTLNKLITFCKWCGYYGSRIFFVFSTLCIFVVGVILAFEALPYGIIVIFMALPVSYCWALIFSWACAIVNLGLEYFSNIQAIRNNSEGGRITAPTSYQATAPVSRQTTTAYQTASVQQQAVPAQQATQVQRQAVSKPIAPAGVSGTHAPPVTPPSYGSDYVQPVDPRR
ncbi:MAG: hypothetical protein GX241_06800 [Ruminococcaceae bacterium]|nr:hypothetical protein [Oscillospiraceae bacterium]